MSAQPLKLPFYRRVFSATVRVEGDRSRRYTHIPWRLQDFALLFLGISAPTIIYAAVAMYGAYANAPATQVYADITELSGYILYMMGIALIINLLLRRRAVLDAEGVLKSGFRMGIISLLSRR